MWPWGTRKQKKQIGNQLWVLSIILTSSRPRAVLVVSHFVDTSPPWRKQTKSSHCEPSRYNFFGNFSPFIPISPCKWVNNLWIAILWDIELQRHHETTRARGIGVCNIESALWVKVNNDPPGLWSHDGEAQCHQCHLNTTYFCSICRKDMTKQSVLWLFPSFMTVPICCDNTVFMIEPGQCTTQCSTQRTPQSSVIQHCAYSKVIKW